MAEFVGNADVHQVLLQPGSNRNLAAIISAVSGHEVDEAHAALVDAELSEADGLSYPMPGVELEVGDTPVTITPLHSPFGERADDPESVMSLIDAGHEAGKAVAILHKASGDPENPAYHWLLLTGHYDGHHEAEGSEKGAYHVMDPAEERVGHMGRSAALDMIGRSMQHMDVYVCTVEAN